MAKIKRIQNLPTPSRMIPERMIVRGFRTSQAMHEFLNRQHDNSWTEYDGDLKPGTYARAGGQWHNVKSLDPSILAHV